ncbi:nucleotidyltransferase family protein [Pelagibacteraceae bacterium]|nr:nucleotidyltransferase family protein [Pelagibacteraceae bacterium]|tara:strand:+ start:410 stop:1108 length:699 start_codon:yes stop_codon:yes gene_type:complete
MTIKKAMILAAGIGKRMRPLTEKIPKPLIKIGPKNFLERSIELLIKMGIDELVINIHHLSQEIDNFLKNKNYGVSITLVKEEKLLDTGGGILNATKKFKNNPFFVLNPDTIWNKNYYEELKILENSYLENNKPILLLVNKINSYDKSFRGDFNFTESNHITRDANNQQIFTGAQIINRSIFESIKKKTFSMNEAWNQMIKEKKLLGQESNQTFFHVNNIKVYEELNKLKFID